MNVQWVHPQGYSKGDRFEMMLSYVHSLGHSLTGTVHAHFGSRHIEHYTYLESDPLVSPCKYNRINVQELILALVGKTRWSVPLSQTC